MINTTVATTNKKTVNAFIQLANTFPSLYSSQDSKKLILLINQTTAEIFQGEELLIANNSVRKLTKAIKLRQHTILQQDEVDKLCQLFAATELKIKKELATKTLEEEIQNQKCTCNVF